jgi:hypothetical protein
MKVYLPQIHQKLQGPNNKLRHCDENYNVEPHTIRGVKE